ncbi:MAG: DUF5683 domain-containing protein [candidate division Zixibacteria bacterium]
MGFVKYLFASISFMFLTATLAAQESAEIVITTKPSGATIYLSGEYDLVANTPARLPIDVSGRYKAKVTRPGYETWKGELTFVPGSANEVEIKLKMKTRFKAAFRSAFLPGWGQVYADNSSKGMLFISTAIISAGTIIYTDRLYGNKSRDYNVALADYNVASSIEDKIRLGAVLSEKQREAYDAETDRNIAIAIGIAGWGLNVLDALLFFPDTDIFYPTVTSLGDGASIAVTARF